MAIETKKMTLDDKIQICNNKFEKLVKELGDIIEVEKDEFFSRQFSQVLLKIEEAAMWMTKALILHDDDKQEG